MAAQHPDLLFIEFNCKFTKQTGGHKGSSLSLIHVQVALLVKDLNWLCFAHGDNHESKVFDLFLSFSILKTLFNSFHM